MINVNLESTKLTLNKPNELNFWLTNSGNEIVTNVIFSINLPVEVILQSGLRKIKIPQLTPGQKVKHSLKVVPKTEGKHIIKSPNFSYRDSLSRGQRIKNLSLEITVIKKENAPPPPKANIDILLQTTELSLNQWQKLKGVVRNIGSVAIETVRLKVVGRIESDPDALLVSLPPESIYSFTLNVRASESGTSVPFNIEATYTDLIKRTERRIIPMSLQVMESSKSDKSSKSEFHFHAPVGSVANEGKIGNSVGEVKGDQIGTQHNYAPEQKQTLAEAAAEIQQLLEQLAKSYPTITENEQQVFVTQFDNQVVKQQPRVQSILIEGGIELLKFICPPLGIPIEMGRTWLETAKDTVQQRNPTQ